MFEHLAQGYALKKAPSTVIPVGISIKAAKEKYNLDTLYKLASNENPYGVSPKALEAMAAALSDCHLYPDSTRDNVLKNKLAEKHNLLPENIMITCGAANALAFAGEAFIKPGDECIITSPAYPPYYYIVYKNNGTIIDIPSRKDDMKLDTEAVLNAVTDKTRLVFVCNPNNPTSTCLSGDELYAFIQKFPKDVIVVVDEAYIDFTDDPEHTTMVSHLATQPNMVVVRTFSKLYGMAGIRMGYALACPEIIGYMNKAMAARSLNTVGIEGAIAALDDEEFRLLTINSNREERDYLTKEFTEMGYRVYESQANFIYVDFGCSCQDLYFALLPYGVMIRGDFPYARISIGTHVQNETLVNAVKDLRTKGEL